MAQYSVCSHIPSGRDVAVKTLHEVIMSNHNSERFFWEAEILNCLHRQNYMHRDLSSNNVLMDIDGTPKICDFGVSHGMNTQQPQSIVPGTSVHMAPQMFTDHYSIEGDVWEFAVLLTEIFNGAIIDSIFDTLPLDVHLLQIIAI
ncbi:hypothetical protein Pelo_18059 [Pelomyxa schiedti]|nr:hypothetical protein Pelo_18059 [Pelomyxa schiedti]